ncbi:MAG: HD domain-containing protein [Caldilinea sp.]
MSNWLTLEDARTLYFAADAAHDFDHVARVTRLAELIAAAEGADLTVVRLAALLHDLPAPAAHSEDHRTAHHWRAAQSARDLLLDLGAGTELVAQVVHCIEAHRFRDQSVQPQTLEARCLYDADKLDSIGAIGAARAFAYAGAHGSRLWVKPVAEIDGGAPEPAAPDYTPVHEYVFKLQRLLATLHTPTARALGAERHATMAAFFAQLDAEMMAATPRHLAK